MRTLYKAFIWFLLSAAFIALPLSFLAYGSDLTTQQSTLYPYQSSVFLQDEFATGSGTASGSVGSLGWALIGGTGVAIVSEANRPGLIRRETSAVSGTTATIRISTATDVLFDPALPAINTFIARLNTNDANTTVRIGQMNASTANPPTNGIYIEKLDGDTNWFCITRSGGVETRVDSSVAVSTSFAVHSYTRNSSGVQFKINNVNVCSLMTTNITTTLLTPAVQITNSAAANKTIDVDYFQLIVTGLVR